MKKKAHATKGERKIKSEGSIIKIAIKNVRTLKTTKNLIELENAFFQKKIAELRLGETHRIGAKITELKLKNMLMR